MQKTITKLEIKKGDRTYIFLLENDSPLGETHDVLIELRQYVVEIANKMLKEQSQKEEVISDAGQ